MGDTRPARGEAASTALGVLLLAGLAACGDAASHEGAAPTVRDSAGVTIVEHPPAPAGAPGGPEWSLAMDEALSLPGDFYQVRGAVRLDDGRFVVGEHGSRSLRFFGADGSPEHTVGGEGEGPGEFRHLLLLARWPGDTLFAWDRDLRRATLFTADGQAARTFSLETTDRVPFAMVRGTHGDGSLLATGFTQTPDTGPESGRRRYPSPAYRYLPDGSLDRILEPAVSSESYFELLNGGFRFMEPLFPGATRLVAGPESLVEANTDRYELRIRRPDGRLVRIVRRAGSPPPVTPELRREAAERAVERAGPNVDREDLLRTYMEMPVPERLPAFGRVHVDRRGHVWVEEYDPDPGPPTRWTVYDPEGHLAGHLEAPARLEPLEIGEDYLLGVLTDELDVEQVVLVPLQR